MAVTPKEETEAERRFWWPIRFTLSILMAAAGAIALVWLGVRFPDRAAHPGYWTATAVIVPIALLLIAGSVWMVRELSPTPTEAVHIPVQPTKGISFFAAMLAAIWVARGWTDLHNQGAPFGSPWSSILDFSLALGLLFAAYRGARSFVRREEWPIGARPPAHQWLQWVAFVYLGALNVRSLEALMIAGGLGAIFAIALLAYFYAHRTPAGEPFRRSDSEMAR